MPKSKRTASSTMTTESHSNTNGIPPTVLARMAESSTSSPHDNRHPLWKGPCGDGPNGGVTQSLLSRFFSCRERFRLKYICGLEPPDRWNHRLGYGNMWHVCEELFAQGKNWKAFSGYIEEEMRKYPLQRDEILKWSCVCKTQFPEYIKYWRDHPDVINRVPVFQEKVFDTPYTLPSGRVVRLRGKIDAVDLFPNTREKPSGYYLFETKTKGDIDREQVERQLSFDLQTMMYLTVLSDDNTLLRTTAGIPVRGVRYNVVRRPLSGGKGNISPHKAKYTKTKVTPAETSEEFYERLRRDYLAADPDYWFFRIRAEISPRDIEVFKQTCLDPVLEHLCYWYDSVTDQSGWMASANPVPAVHYRTPFGMYSALEENGATEYDAYLATGSEIGLRRVTQLFGELK